MQRKPAAVTLCAPPRRPHDHPRDQLAQRHAVLGRHRRARRRGGDDVLPGRARLVVRGHRPGVAATTRSAAPSAGRRRRSARWRCSTSPSAWTVYLASDDADRTAKLIVENGGSLLVEPTDIGDNGRMCVARRHLAAACSGSGRPSRRSGWRSPTSPGSLVWTDARLTDPVAGKEFYAAVFGYRYQPVPGAPDDYATFLVDGPGGRRHGRDARRGRRRPAHWLAYFSVDDVDATVADALRPGAALPSPRRTRRSAAPPCSPTRSAPPSACTDLLTRVSAGDRGRARRRIAGDGSSARSPPAGSRTSRTAGPSSCRPATRPRPGGSPARSRPAPPAAAAGRRPRRAEHRPSDRSARSGSAAATRRTSGRSRWRSARAARRTRARAAGQEVSGRNSCASR